MADRDQAPDAPLADVEWRAQGKIDRGGGVRVVAYLDGPTVARLLDEWVGPWRWRDAYESAGKQGLMWCHLSVRDPEGEWITKSDLGKESDQEAAKGLVSDAFKRAAMRKWRVGANVYSLPVLRLTEFRRVERSGNPDLAYLTAASEKQIAEMLRERGFEEAANQTRVDADENDGGPDLAARAQQKATEQANFDPAPEDVVRGLLQDATKVWADKDNARGEVWKRLHHEAKERGLPAPESFRDIHPDLVGPVGQWVGEQTQAARDPDSVTEGVPF